MYGSPIMGASVSGGLVGTGVWLGRAVAGVCVGVMVCIGLGVLVDVVG